MKQIKSPTGRIILFIVVLLIIGLAIVLILTKRDIASGHEYTFKLTPVEVPLSSIIEILNPPKVAIQLGIAYPKNDTVTKVGLANNEAPIMEAVKRFFSNLRLEDVNTAEKREKLKPKIKQLIIRLLKRYNVNANIIDIYYLKFEILR